MRDNTRLVRRWGYWFYAMACLGAVSLVVGVLGLVRGGEVASGLLGVAWQILLVGLVGMAGSHCTEAIVAAIRERETGIFNGERKPPKRG